MGELYVLEEKTQVNQKGSLTRAVLWALMGLAFHNGPKTVFPDVSKK